MGKATSRPAPKAAPVPPSISKHFNMKSKSIAETTLSDQTKSRPIKGDV